MKLKSKDVYIFSHIPKTAGTTLRIHFQQHLEDQVEFIHLANKGNKWAMEKGMLEYCNRTQSEREKAKVILGHQVNFKTKYLVPTLNPIEIVAFREPISWEKSRYNQYVNRRVNNGLSQISFKQWITENEKTHSQFEWFLSNYLMLKANIRQLNDTSKENLLMYTLSNFSHILFLENIDVTMNRIFAKLKIPSNPERKNVVGEHKKNFYLDNEENYALLMKVTQKEVNLYKKLKKEFNK